MGTQIHKSPRANKLFTPMKGSWQAIHTGQPAKKYTTHNYTNTQIQAQIHKSPRANKLFTPMKGPWQAIHTGQPAKKIRNTQLHKYTNTSTNTQVPSCQQALYT